MQIQHQQTQRGGEFFIERDGRHIAEITYQYQDDDENIIANLSMRRFT